MSRLRAALVVRRMGCQRKRRSQGQGNGFPEQILVSSQPCRESAKITDEGRAQGQERKSVRDRQRTEATEPRQDGRSALISPHKVDVSQRERNCRRSSLASVDVSRARNGRRSVKTFALYCILLSRWEVQVGLWRLMEGGRTRVMGDVCGSVLVGSDAGCGSVICRGGAWLYQLSCVGDGFGSASADREEKQAISDTACFFVCGRGVHICIHLT